MEQIMLHAPEMIAETGREGRLSDAFIDALWIDCKAS